MEVNFKVTSDVDPNIITDAATPAELILATQVMKDTRPYVPAQTESLNNRTRIVGGNTIQYPAPYSRYLYYGKVMVDEHNRHAVYIEDVGWRFRRGAKLHATDRDLVFSKDVHPLAQAFWFEASKAVNLEKWKRVAKEALLKYG